MEATKYVLKNGKYEKASSINSYVLYPEKDFPHIEEINASLEKALSGRIVAVLEKICGKHFKIYFDEKTFHIGSKIGRLFNSEKYYNIKEILSENGYRHSLAELSKKLHSVNFTIFGEIVSEETEDGIKYLRESEKTKLVFYDIYLNKNWMNWDDLRRILKEVNLKYPPLLYLDTFDSKKIKSLLKEKSSFSSLESETMEGIVIRPLLEDTYRRDGSYSDLRLITKIISKEFIKQLPAPKVIIQPRKHPASISYNILNEYTEDNQIKPYWEDLLEKKGIKVRADNFEKIIGIITSDTIEMLMDSITMEALDNFAEEEEVIDTMKKQIPWRIRRILEI